MWTVFEDSTGYYYDDYSYMYNDSAAPPADGDGDDAPLETDTGDDVVDGGDADGAPRPNVATMFNVTLTHVVDGFPIDCRSCESEGALLSKDGLSCERCPAGSMPNLKKLTCEPCAPNTYRSDTMEACEPCKAGLFSPAGADRCESDCTLGAFNFTQLVGLHELLVPGLYAKAGDHGYAYRYFLQLCGDAAADMPPMATGEGGAAGAGMHRRMNETCKLTWEEAGVDTHVCRVRPLVYQGNEMINQKQDLGNVLESITIIEADGGDASGAGIVSDDGDGDDDESSAAGEGEGGSGSLPAAPAATSGDGAMENFSLMKGDVMFKYTGGDTTRDCPGGMSTRVTLRCDAFAGHGAPRYAALKREECVHAFLWQSSYACPLCSEDDYHEVVEECRPEGQRKKSWTWNVGGMCRDGVELPAPVMEPCEYVDVGKIDEMIADSVAETNRTLQAQIEQHRQEAADAAALADRNKYIVIGCLGGILLLVIVAFVLYRKNRNLKHKYSQLTQKSFGNLPAPETCGEDSLDDLHDDEIGGGANGTVPNDHFAIGGDHDDDDDDRAVLKMAAF